ncbi:SMODS domain-containing nucleotidyltransferase [Limnovirga soli]|jgi:tRNA nucleotidyltransferase (CCA-adding enzyme)|uniref:Nucleotidyltransferase n=1 Tax=Limnovirga soli TaxID=2656915 RepID=A0A8J8JS55_9BACT|nr:hypothetical protein [Limnovirga soli]NNV54378.1 hypothetical protein [Limnovirga soli]
MFVDTDTYLTNLDNFLLPQTPVVERIDECIRFLKERIWGMFQDNLVEVNVFGSYENGTFIQQDKDADVNIIIVFKQKGFQPNAYMNRIHDFCLRYNKQATIYKDHPTASIRLDNYTFELVPAIYISKDKVRIPAPQDDPASKWILTSPKALKTQLNNKDNLNNQLIKPSIRVIKYWNTLKNKPFSSFAIERQILSTFFFCKAPRDYFFIASNSLKKLAITDPQLAFMEEIRESTRRLNVFEKHRIPEYIGPEISRILPMD